MKSSRPDVAALAKQLAELLAQGSDAPANEDEPDFDDEAIRTLAKKHAEEMKRARKR